MTHSHASTSHVLLTPCWRRTTRPTVRDRRRRLPKPRLVRPLAPLPSIWTTASRRRPANSAILRTPRRPAGHLWTAARRRPAATAAAAAAGAARTPQVWRHPLHRTPRTWAPIVRPRVAQLHRAGFGLFRVVLVAIEAVQRCSRTLCVLEFGKCKTVCGLAVLGVLLYDTDLLHMHGPA